MSHVNDLITVPQAAKILGRSLAHTVSYIHDGLLTAHRLGPKARLVHRNEVEGLAVVLAEKDRATAALLKLKTRAA